MQFWKLYFMISPKVVLTLALCLSVLNGISQSITISVVDFMSGDALVGAHVTNQRTGLLDISNTLGKVDLSDYEHSDTLIVSMLNYSEYKILPDDLKYNTVIRLFPEVITVSTAEKVYVAGREISLEEVPQKVEVIGVSEIKFRNPQTTAHMLENSGAVMVQRSQMGGGSPILRGFEANKVLLVVDGVRLNNAIYRGGHLQNAITVDNSILQQSEVIFGPNSVLYGSDALGGVIHFRTRQPKLSTTPGVEHVSGHVMSRLSSANQEKTFHVDVNVGSDRFGSLTSFTRSSYGDLKMGSNRDHGDSEWGLVKYYADFEEGADLNVVNPDPTVQRGTAYDQLDFVQKFLLQASEDLMVTANFQYSTSSDVPRFDRLNDVDGDQVRWAEWHYGPQNRLLFSLRMDLADSNKVFDDVAIIAATQRIDEDRIQRRFGQSTRNTQSEDVWVHSLNADFQKDFPKTQVNYGVEFTHNVVESNASFFDLGSGETGLVPTRYPNGGASMTTGALYLAARRGITKKLKTKIGARYSYATLDASFENNPFYDLPFDVIDFGRGALTGSLGLIYTPDSTWKINTVFSSGYRSPNVDDFGKVREKDGFVLVPNDFLEPEYAYSGELTVIKRLLNDKVQLTGTGYYTLLNNAIVQRDYTLNGQDSLFVEGTLARIQTNFNASSAFIYGYFFGLKSTLCKDLSFKASYNFTFGQEDENDVPLAHIPPAFGQVALQYNTKKFRGEIGPRFNLEKPEERYAAGSTDNPAEALPSGTPGWWTLNLNTSYYISPVFEAQFAVENILDKHYKVFASGLSAPGRNFIIALRGTF